MISHEKDPTELRTAQCRMKLGVKYGTTFHDRVALSSNQMGGKLRRYLIALRR
eukprot:CAMPEP_0185775844 /NCGR_PEP_ID=MMETSP1174-20130828/83466_1 /TAXON_ID=35687 /ORGANISM="Dictyocha speculum, Strain CCMP1381" /LENGTH=52 /DNA_ID=CAMNT_0028463543 /DNA_START=426 /DNA_END=584 /DNA_ORIENTATION=-